MAKKINFEFDGIQKKIICAGYEQCDFVYYLACTLSMFVNRIIVIDDSVTQDLFNAVCDDVAANVHEWRNIVFTRNVDIKDSQEFADADIVIDYAGLNEDFEIKTDDENTLWIAMPDYTKAGIKSAKRLNGLNPEKIICIPRNYCSQKITDKSVSVLSGIPMNNIVGHISFNTEDIAAYITLTHNRHHYIKSASAEMKDAVILTVANLFDLEEKTARKMVFKTKKLKKE